jgi:hypothetical protein
VGQLLPFSLKVPEGSNWATKTPNFKGEEGTCVLACWLAPAGLEPLAATTPAVSASTRQSRL